MKAFLISLVLLVVVAAGASIVLGSFERNAATVYASDNVRLN